MVRGKPEFMLARQRHDGGCQWLNTPDEWPEDRMVSLSGPPDGLADRGTSLRGPRARSPGAQGPLDAAGVADQVDQPGQGQQGVEGEVGE
jgi:hypothetical protein